MLEKSRPSRPGRPCRLGSQLTTPLPGRARPLASWCGPSTGVHISDDCGLSGVPRSAIASRVERAPAPCHRRGRPACRMPCWPLANRACVVPGRLTRGGARAVSSQGAHRPSVPEWRTGRQSRNGAQAVSPGVAHGPSVPEWRTGRQPRNGTRAVSPGVAHGPSVPERPTGRQSRCGAPAVSPSVAHGPSDPEWRTGRQSRSGARAVSPGETHGPSVPA